MKYIILGTLSLLLCVAFINAQKPAYCQAPQPIPSFRTDGMTLQMVQVITRHGDRTPLFNTFNSNMNQWDCSLGTYMYPSQNTQENALSNVNRLFRKVYMPNREYLPGNCSVGQLTSLGYSQHIQLGSSLHDLYVQKYELLSPQLDPTELYFRSTDVPRTLQSAQGNIQGLYPAATNPSGILNINTMDSYFEDMIPNSKLCPALVNLNKNATTTPEYIAWENQNAALKQQVMQILGLTSFPGYWYNILDFVYTSQCHDLPIPQGMTQSIIDQVYQNAMFEYKYPLTFPIVARLSSAPFLAELVQNIKAFVAGQTNTKYFLFSGHDSSIAPFVNLFGIFNDWPGYASHVEIELWADFRNDYYIQFKYNGENYELEGCDNYMCTIEDFLNLSESLIVPDYANACNNATSLYDFY
ncbi:hypothetical protein CYY_008708 [Polysphondylium violaceum]|uniref:Histidine acid phosphatase family protein n=1 Tax=Polysphondylium violaceum TaxID=133409 RepID=A0A8J4PL64_9MYCE|nr:hypothetical protein CYY_008708 [Polysphondylium violaceum]